MDGDVVVTRHGLAPDEEAGLSLSDAPREGDTQGPVSRAVYAYPHQHYATWQTLRAQARAAAWNVSLPYGSLGEDLCLSGLSETDVWVGDVLRFARCELAVSEPRIPGPEFDAAMGFPQAGKMMIQSGWCGFYLAVRQAGRLAAHETFELIPGPRDISISELFASSTGRWSRGRQQQGR